MTKVAGPVDILVNNAGISRCGEFSELNVLDFEVKIVHSLKFFIIFLKINPIFI